MKKLFIILSLILIILNCPIGMQKTDVAGAQTKPKIAIVIDDFGEDRRGVEEMLNLDCKLTIAVLPGMEYSTLDAETAHQKGKEVILHLPMENMSYMPPEYYGPVVVKNTHTKEEAKEVLNKALQTVPYAVGVNNHMGTGITQNKELMSGIIEECKSKGLYFLDSRTIPGTVCEEVAKEIDSKFYGRNFFLEPSGTPSEMIAKEELSKAMDYALKNGSAVVIGHVGCVGEEKTAKAISDTLQTIYNKGIEVVFLSEL